MIKKRRRTSLILFLHGGERKNASFSFLTSIRRSIFDITLIASSLFLSVNSHPSISSFFTFFWLHGHPSLPHLSFLSSICRLASLCALFLLLILLPNFVVLFFTLFVLTVRFDSSKFSSFNCSWFLSFQFVVIRFMFFFNSYPQVLLGFSLFSVLYNHLFFVLRIISIEANHLHFTIICLLDHMHDLLLSHDI